jgi:hypothetical protein
LWLVVAIPTYAVALRPIVLLEIVVHVAPLGEEYAVTVEPFLTSLTQYGAGTDGP